MQEVIVVCEQNCPSKQALLSRLDAIIAEYPQISYRSASPQESQEYIKAYQTPFTPFLIINQAPVYTISSKEKILAALLLL